jgi:hypothetical protein
MIRRLKIVVRIANRTCGLRHRHKSVRQPRIPLILEESAVLARVPDSLLQHANNCRSSSR